MGVYGLHLRASVRFREMAPPSKFGQKGKKLQYFFKFKHFSLFSNRISADFIQTNSKIPIWNDISKKNFFSILKFCDQLLIHIKTELFFNKDGSKIKTKKFTT